jgi:hypothetical protein
MVNKVLAVLGGYVLIGLLVVLTDRFVAPPLAVTLLTDTVYTVIGGFVCAAIARTQTRGPMLGLIVFGEVMGIASAIAGWSTQPHWFAISLLIVYPPAVWIGYSMKPSLKAGELPIAGR